MLIRILKSEAAAALGGALGGAFVGLIEALFVTATSTASKEYWLFLFGVASYAVVGAVIGIGVGTAWQLLRLGRATSLSTAQIAFAMAVAVPAFAVGRYHVIQRVFREDLVLASTAGILTHVLLLGAAALVAFLTAWLFRRWYARTGPIGAAGLLGVLLVLTAAIGATTGTDTTTAVARRPAAASATGKPNVILIVVDTLRADAIEPYGAPAQSTPAVAEFARDGVVFERAYAQASWTRPSIASILTSQYPAVHGAVHKMDFLPDRAFTLAEALRADGYWTTAFVNNINVAPVFNFQQGFDEYVYLEPGFYFGATESATKLTIYKGLRVARERLFGSRIYFPNYYQDAEVVNQHVINWLEQKPPEPFFLLIHYMDPHDPYFEIPYNGHGVARVLTPSPPPEQAAELRKLYAEEVTYLDEHLQQLFKRLRDKGLYDRSTIILTADHGEEFLDHGGWWHGTTLYEEQVHVPLIMKRAGESLRGERRPDFARSIDIGPSVMIASGLALPPSFMGRDLFAAAAPSSEPLLAEEDLEGNQLASLRSGDWKLITANPGNPRGLATIELYNLNTDPKERTNLAGQEKEKVAELLDELRRFLASLSSAAPRLGARESDATHPRI